MLKKFFEGFQSTCGGTHAQVVPRGAHRHELDIVDEELAGTLDEEVDPAARRRSEGFLGREMAMTIR